MARRSLGAEGVRTVLVNSNPATIMTDPTVADAVYLEPLTVPAIEANLLVPSSDAGATPG